MRYLIQKMLLFSGLPALLFHASCKGDSKDTIIRADMVYTGSDTVAGPPGADDTARYTQFGAYIGSLTPRVFKGKFRTIRFQDVWKSEDAMLMEMIDNNAPDNDTQRYAVFSSGSEVRLYPKIYWANKGGRVKDKQVGFAYFYWDLQWFYQLLDLPAAYNGVELQQFQTEFNYIPNKGGKAQRDGSLSSDHYPFIDPIFGNPPGEMPSLFAFGNTDSTFVYNLELQPVGNNINNPMGGLGTQPIIRSNRYNPLQFVYSEGETMDIRAVVTFDYQNLVQMYAGPDGQAYTRDDVLVYAPRFWERLQVRVEQKR